jgi:hypothetical protein
MHYQELHKGDRVRLTDDYQEESKNHTAGEKGEVCGFDNSLVVVTIAKHGNIAVTPQLLEPVGS